MDIVHTIIFFNLSPKFLPKHSFFRHWLHAFVVLWFFSRKWNKYKFNLHYRNEVSENSDSEEEDVGEFPGKKEIVTFLQWLTFCDKVKFLHSSSLRTGIPCTVPRFNTLLPQCLLGRMLASTSLKYLNTWQEIYSTRQKYVAPGSLWCILMAKKEWCCWRWIHEIRSMWWLHDIMASVGSTVHCLAANSFASGVLERVDFCCTLLFDWVNLFLIMHGVYGFHIWLWPLPKSWAIKP